MGVFLLVLLLATVTVARVVRLVAVDKITEPARARLISWRGPDSQLVYLAHCPMCLAVWAGAAGATAVWWTVGADLIGITTWVGVPILWGTIAYAAGYVVGRES